MTYLMVAGGLVLLLLGGDVLVRGAVSLARCWNVSPLVIGVTIVALGTSAPELVVCVDAALSGAPELAIGNVVGSNIANVLLVLGLPAAIYPFVTDGGPVRRDTLLMVLASVLFIVFAWQGEIGTVQGVIMVAGLACFLGYSYHMARRGGSAGEAGMADELDELSGRPGHLWRAIGFVVGGLVGLVLGAHWLVDGAMEIALAAGISQAVIGLTLLAIGTSLPELATSVVAALRHHADVAIGNVVGSNLFNILGIMGVTAIVHPVPVPAAFLGFDLWLMLGAAVFLLLLVCSGRSLNRLAGAVLSLAYVGYIAALFTGLSAVASGSGL